MWFQEIHEIVYHEIHVTHSKTQTKEYLTIKIIKFSSKPFSQLNKSNSVLKVLPQRIRLLERSKDSKELFKIHFIVKMT